MNAILNLFATGPDLALIKDPAAVDRLRRRRVAAGRLGAWTLGCLMLAGCARSGNGTGIVSPANQGSGGAGGSGPLIALVVKTLNNPYFIDMQNGAEAAAKDAHVQLTVQAAEREVDVERQLEIIENLIQRRVAVLIIAPSGSREIVPAIVKANQAGIPVIIVDTRADAQELAAAGGSIATFIGSDNFEGGKLAGQFLSRRMGGRAQVAVLEGIPGHETGDARLRGFRAALAEHPEMQIVASQPANWERDQGYNVFQNILQAHPTVNALFAASDLMALGAVEAIAAAGKTGAIAVVGFDAQDEARLAVSQGSMAATVAQNANRMGAIAVMWAAQILQGRKPPAEIAVPIKLISKP